MKETANYRFKKPEKNEYINIDVLNENMDKVDLELKKLKNANTNAINHQNCITMIPLSSSAWIGLEPPYIQMVAVDGVTAEDNPLLVSALEDGASPEEYKAYNRAFGIIASGIGITADGSVTFKVYKKPAVDIVVGLRGVGASGSVAAGANVTNMTYSAVAPRSGENWARIVSGRLEVDPQEVSKDTTYLAQDLDADRAYLYRNTGTQTSPVWEKWYPRTTADAVEMDNGKTVEECLKDNSGGVDGLSIANGALCVTYNEEEKDV